MNDEPILAEKYRRTTAELADTVDVDAALGRVLAAGRTRRLRHRATAATAAAMTLGLGLWGAQALSRPDSMTIEALAASTTAAPPTSAKVAPVSFESVSALVEALRGAPHWAMADFTTPTALSDLVGRGDSDVLVARIVDSELVGAPSHIFDGIEVPGSAPRFQETSIRFRAVPVDGTCPSMGSVSIGFSLDISATGPAVLDRYLEQHPILNDADAAAGTLIAMPVPYCDAEEPASVWNVVFGATMDGAVITGTENLELPSGVESFGDTVAYLSERASR
jgi:hypothetical protein